MEFKLQLRLLISEPGADRERLAELARRLRTDLLLLDVDDATPLGGGPAPVGAKGGSAPEDGGLLVVLDESDAGLQAVLSVTRDWLQRQTGDGVAVRAEVSGTSVKLDQGRPAEHDQLIDMLVRFRDSGERLDTTDSHLTNPDGVSPGGVSRGGGVSPDTDRGRSGLPGNTGDAAPETAQPLTPGSDPVIGLPRPGYPAPDDVPPPAVDLRVATDMPSRLQVDELVSVACHISREDIDAAADRVRADGRIAADPSRRITVEVLPKTNVEVVGEDRADVPVPDEGATTDLYFDIRPTDPGICQVWVVVRQGPAPLLTLRLEAPAMVEPPAVPVARYPVEARVAVGEATGLDDGTWLSVMEMDRGPDTVYRFELRSTALNVLATFESPPLRNRAAYVASLYREIESRWLSSQRDVKAFQEELREFGGSLLSQLFPEPLQEILWRLRDKLKDLIVLSAEPFIPWELVHLKEPGQPLPDEPRFLAETGLVRWLYTRDHAYLPQTLRARAGRVRVLCPDYADPDLRLVTTRDEADFLATSLGATPVPANESDVRALLRSGDFDILHFAGHGQVDGDDIANAKILLDGRKENGRFVRSAISATTVDQQARLAGPDGSRPLVVLNACQTGRLGQQMSSLGGFAQAFLERGAGAFVSSMWSVRDEPASSFVTTFYRELMRGQPLSAAAVEARKAARETGDSTWLAYAVYAHPRARLLTSEPAPAQHAPVDGA